MWESNWEDMQQRYRAWWNKHLAKTAFVEALQALG